MSNNKDYILIADGGSTKVEWCLVSISGNIEAEFQTEGINPAITAESDINRYFLSVKNIMDTDIHPSRIYYYGAGCATKKICATVANAIMPAWSPQKVEVESDMLGACRSMLANNAGIICILGTGSNSALYDGDKIIANVPPLGFILGDEGSGTALGKRIISDIFKKIAPNDIIEAFQGDFHISIEEVIEHTYRQPRPNTFLASFVPFIAKHINHPYMHKLVADNFIEFLSRNVLQYGDVINDGICFIGSLAAIFSRQLREAAATLRLKVLNIEQRPMSGLINYHLTDYHLKKYEKI